MNDQHDPQQAAESASDPPAAVADPGSRASNPDLLTSAEVLKALGADSPEVAVASSTRISTMGATESTEISQPDRSAGRYQLQGEIARGGMGAVLKGRDTNLCRDIAIKVLLQKHQSKTGLHGRFVEEAQIAGQLQHPGVVPVYELGTLPDQRPYFTMKLVKGETLAKLLSQRADPSQDRPRLLKVFEQICQTLAYAHSRGVIHRDLKPHNVMVGAFGEVQVMDWGLAKVLREENPTGEPRPPQPAEVSVIYTQRADSDENEGVNTVEGSVIGTPAYIPPEQALGEVDRVDERADVFGLGAILCQILTGQPPYVGANRREVQRKAVRADLTDALARLDSCGADADLISLAKRCLAAEPEGRPRDAGVLARELTAYLDSVESRLHQAELTGAEARARAAEERKRRKLAIALGSAVLGLFLLGGGSWIYLLRERAEREHAMLVRQAEASRQIQDLLGRADSLRQQAQTGNDPAKWHEARALVERALSLVAHLPERDQLALQVKTVADELTAEEQDQRLLARLEEISLTRAEADFQSPSFALRRTLSEYPPAFAQHGLGVGDSEKAAAAWLLRRPPKTRERLLAGLDAWLALARQLKAPEAGWLFGILQSVDADAWRNGLRAAIARDDAAELNRLANSEELERQPAQTVLLLVDYFRPRSQDRTVDLLRAAQARFPGDFSITFALADALNQKHFQALSEPAQFEDAVRFFTAALALRPKNDHVQTLLGWSLWLHGRRTEGRALVQKVINRQPEYFGAHLYLGAMCMWEGRDEEAEKALREAIHLEPNSGMAWSVLGFVLWGRGQNQEALAALRRCNRLEPYPRNYLGLAVLLASLSRMDESVAVCNQALEFQRDFQEAVFYRDFIEYLEERRAEKALFLLQSARLFRHNVPELHAQLSMCQIALGRFDKALEAAQDALKLARKSPTIPVGLLDRLVQEIESFRKLEPLLPEYIQGKESPSDARELTLLVTLCWTKQQYAGAARLYSSAFADARLADDVAAELRYDAARYAARAAAGLGDAAKFGEKERANWRKRALDWLQADLAGWNKWLKKASADDRAVVQERLTWWQQDPKLAGLRDSEALKKLPAEEQKAWRELWKGVAETLAALQK